MFEFTTTELPSERVIHRYKSSSRYDILLPKLFFEAARPMIVVGQLHSDWVDPENDDFRELCRFFQDYGVVLSEPLNNIFGGCPVDAALTLVGDDPDYQPDVVVYLGGHIVSKRLKRFLRRSQARVVMVSSDPAIHDVTMNVTDVIVQDPFVELEALCYFYIHNTFADAIGASDDDDEEAQAPFYTVNPAHDSFHRRWAKVLAQARQHTADFVPAYSQMAAVRYLDEQLGDAFFSYQLHYANSSAVRLACLYADNYACHFTWCNRGVNGIEGTVSTAAGFAVALQQEADEKQEEVEKVICVVGDLSFFYDQNALWNTNLTPNLRIVLLNNGGGGIFHSLQGLEQSPVRETFVAAAHHTTAQGICTQCDVGYLRATNEQEMQEGMVRLLTQESKRPMLLEIVTDAATDAEQVRLFYAQLTHHSS